MTKINTHIRRSRIHLTVLCAFLSLGAQAEDFQWENYTWEIATYNNWAQILQFTPGEHTFEEARVYGLRGDGDLPYALSFANTDDLLAGTTIRANKLTLILRPKPIPVDQIRFPSLLDITATSGHTKTVTIDAPLVVDMESFATTPQSAIERAKGIRVYSDVNGKARLTLLGLTAIRAIDGNTRSELPAAAQSVRALTTESWDGGSSELFVKNKLLIYAETPRAHMLPAVDINDTNAAQRGSLVVFDADVQVDTVGRLGGTLTAFRSWGEFGGR